jgi:hypothetical protein
VHFLTWKGPTKKDAGGPILQITTIFIVVIFDLLLSLKAHVCSSDVGLWTALQDKAWQSFGSDVSSSL